MCGYVAVFLLLLITLCCVLWFGSSSSSPHRLQHTKDRYLVSMSSGNPLLFASNNIIIMPSSMSSCAVPRYNYFVCSSSSLAVSRRRPLDLPLAVTPSVDNCYCTSKNLYGERANIKMIIKLSFHPLSLHHHPRHYTHHTQYDTSHRPRCLLLLLRAAAAALVLDRINSVSVTPAPTQATEYNDHHHHPPAV